MLDKQKLYLYRRRRRNISLAHPHRCSKRQHFHYTTSLYGCVRFSRRCQQQRWSLKKKEITGDMVVRKNVPYHRTEFIHFCSVNLSSCVCVCDWRFEEALDGYIFRRLCIEKLQLFCAMQIFRGKFIKNQLSNIRGSRWELEANPIFRWNTGIHKQFIGEKTILSNATLSTNRIQMESSKEEKMIVPVQRRSLRLKPTMINCIKAEEPIKLEKIVKKSIVRLFVSSALKNRECKFQLQTKGIYRYIETFYVLCARYSYKSFLVSHL